MVSRRSGDGPRKQRSGLFSNSGQSPVAMRSRATAGRCPASTAMAAPPCAACELAGQGRFPGDGKYREPRGIVSIFRKKFIGLGRIVSVPNRSRAGGCAPMVPAGNRRRISGSECCIRRMEPPRQGGVRRLPENPGAGHSGPSRATHAKSCSTSFFAFSRAWRARLQKYCITGIMLTLRVGAHHARSAPVRASVAVGAPGSGLVKVLHDDAARQCETAIASGNGALGRPLPVPGRSTDIVQLC